MSSPSTTTRILVTDQGFVREDTKTTLLAGVDDVLKEFANRSAVKIPFAASLNGNPVGLSLRANTAYAYTFLPTFQIVSPVNLREDRITLNFTAGGSPVPMMWEAPDTMRVAFMITAVFEGGLWHPGNAYLVAFSSNQPGAFRLPLANMWEDSRFCMGNDGMEARPDLLSTLGAAVQQFNASRYNADLASGSGVQANTDALFRWDLNGKQIPPEKDWERYCRKVNNTHLEAISL